MRRLCVVAPWLEPSDESTARAYCELEILGASIFASVAQMNGAVKASADGRDLEVRKLVDAHRTNRLAMLAYARELGLTPAARQALKAAGTRAAFDLPGAMANAEDVVALGEQRQQEREKQRDGSE